MTPHRSLTDDQITDALASRATRTRARGELVAQVLVRVDAVPQRGAGIDLGGHGRIAAVLVAAGLVLALIAGVVSSGGAVLDPRDDYDLIAFSSATYTANRWVTASGRALSTIPVTGAPPRRLTEFAGDIRITNDSLSDGIAQAGHSLRWSPDGTMIAYRLYGDRPGIYLVARDGGEPRLLAATIPAGSEIPPNEAVATFAWSPDGSRIAFIAPTLPPWPPRGASNGKLYVVDVSSGHVRRLDDAANGSLAWSPDGMWIAFGRTRPGTSDVVVIGANGGGERVIEDGGPANHHPGAIAWAPDGSRLAFEATRFGGPREGEFLVVVNADGTDPSDVAQWNSGCCYHGAFGGLLEWSPDGRLIGLPMATAGGSHIGLVAADGSGVQVEISGDWFDWSPDGSQLVVSAPDAVIDGSTHRSDVIYVVDADGSHRRWLADGEFPQWSP
jgi:hypothetical protein